jgi:orotate phosphoribosyltransferase
VAFRLIEVVGARSGHFDLGTGYHGDVWLDLDALFMRPAVLRAPVRELAEWLRGQRVDAVCGPMEGGAFLAYALADVLEAGFLPGYRGSGVAEYRLAAGTEIAGWRVAIVDDAVNAGTAVRACAGQLRERGAEPVAVAALLAVGPAADGAADALPLAEGWPVPFYAVESVRSRAWLPADCALCADGVPLTG